MCGCNSIFVGLQPPVPVYILPIEINNTAGECVRYIRTGLYIIRTSMSDILCLPLEQWNTAMSSLILLFAAALMTFVSPVALQQVTLTYWKRIALHINYTMSPLFLLREHYSWCYVMCCDESCLIASTFLQTQQGARSITVEYRVEFPDATCSNATPPFPLNLTTERFSNVLTVMERAADVGSSYRFSATYFSNTLGYSIDAISGVENNNSCFWLLYIQEPYGFPKLSNLGVSNFFIPSNGFTVIWRFS